MLFHFHDVGGISNIKFDIFQSNRNTVQKKWNLVTHCMLIRTHPSRDFQRSKSWLGGFAKRIYDKHSIHNAVPDSQPCCTVLCGYGQTRADMVKNLHRPFLVLHRVRVDMVKSRGYGQKSFEKKQNICIIIYFIQTILNPCLPVELHVCHCSSTCMPARSAAW